ncbi:MAG: Kelch repeat-containing protein [Chloroflexia bacterium]
MKRVSYFWCFLLGAAVLGMGLVGLSRTAGAALPTEQSVPRIADRFHHLSGVVAVPPAEMLGQGLGERRNVLLTPPVFGPNVSASLNDPSAQNETTIAINPDDSQRVIASANDYRCNLCPEVYLSSSGGTTWANYPVPGVTGLYYGDPAMTFDHGGHAYFGYLGYQAICTAAGGMYVSRSTDAGASFSAPLQLAANTNNGQIAVFQDKDYVAVDANVTSPYSGTVYEGWTHFVFQAGSNCGAASSQRDASTILSKSSDHGITWSVPITVSPVFSNNNQGTVPAIGRHGEVYAYYLGAQTQSQLNYDTVLFSRSTDGGQTFPFFTHIASITDLPSPLPHTNFRDNAFGAMAVDQQLDGYLYAVWADYRTGDADILFSRSTDNGTTWGAPQRVNDDPVGNGKDQFFPWIATSPDGRVHIGWFDRREDPNDANYKEYYADSLDHGASFEPNVAVSSAPSIPGTSGFIGDYSGIAAVNGLVIPVWTDIRNGSNQDAYVAQGIYTSTQGTPSTTPTGTATAAATSTGTATMAASPTGTATPIGCGALPAWQFGPPRNPAREYIQGAIGTDGKLYTAGGWSGANPPVLNDASRFNPATNAWESLPTLPVPEGVYGMGSANGKIYVVGGSDIPTRTLTTTVQVFDIGANAWSFAPSVPRATGVQGPAVATVNNHLYVIGGADNNNVYSTTNILDLTTNTWTTGAPLPNALFLSGATATDGLVYVFGGADNAGNSTDTLYAYNPSTDTWATLASANTGGLGVVPSISPYGAGRLIATLGTDYATFARRTTLTRIYDIAGNTWSDGPLVNDARYGNAQGTLPDGRVLIYGGSAATAGSVGGKQAPRRERLAVAVPDALTASSELLPPQVVCTPTPTSVATATGTTTQTATPVVPSATVPATATPTTPPANTATPTTQPGTSPTATTQPAATFTPTAPPAATATPTACTINFSDVHMSDYFYTPVQYLYCHGVISGYSDGTFRPYNPTTRSQMVKIVVLGFQKAIRTPSGGSYTFTDVTPGNNFYAVVETASADGIVSGYTCGTAPAGPCDAQHRPYFLPYNNVTRGQLAKIDVIAAGWALYNPAVPTFSDVPRGSTFYTVIETAVCHGVVSGYSDGTFRPYSDATRGQISKIVYLSIVNPPVSCGP